ncbi:hypothetical protein NMY22_g3924 [Coprinellus aureogranulatus]|nr:hypothetical protein NMY22_g3924 [Coprinellus aureogranulatus]
MTDSVSSIHGLIKAIRLPETTIVDLAFTDNEVNIDQFSHYITAFIIASVPHLTVEWDELGDGHANERREGGEDGASDEEQSGEESGEGPEEE